MKKLLALCLGLTLCLCACARRESVPALAPRTAAPAPEGTLALFGNWSDSWYAPICQAGSDWAGERGWAVVCYDYAGWESTLELQVDDLERRGGADVAVLCAGEGQDWQDRWAAALAGQGARVLTVTNNSALRQSPEARGHMGPGSQALAKAAEEYLRNGPGAVVLRDTLDSPLEEQTVRALGPAALVETYTWGDAEYAQAAVLDALTLCPTAGTVLCFSPTGVRGARAALDRWGDGVSILALGESAQLWETLEEGGLDALAAVEAQEAAQKLPGTLDQLSRGRDPGTVELTPRVVTAPEDQKDEKRG